MKDEDLPIVVVKWNKSKTEVKVKCPYCREVHHHGIPGGVVGKKEYRVAHCLNGKSYRLVEADA